MRVELLLRLLGGLALGGSLLYFSEDQRTANLVGDLDRLYVWCIAAGGLVVGAVVTPYLTVAPFHWLLDHVRRQSPSDLIGGLSGFVLGLFCAVLMAIPLSMLPSSLGQILPIIACLFLARLGISVGIMRKKDFIAVLGARWGGVQEAVRTVSPVVLLDTSAIVDGRIADISLTGFLPGGVVVPRFVLNELQHIADSPDALRRNRGRRGLDVLGRLQKEAVVPVELLDTTDDPNEAVDSRLVKLARERGATIVTGDFNLNRVAELQGVKVLNVNALANAVRAVVLPGEEMSVRLIQEGKELNQGVGYLEDGTMVVVENGRKLLNNDVSITVSRVLQTVAGRMVFAQLRGEQVQT